MLLQHKKQINAFSLIELSVVILIIGILIAGISSGSRLIGSYKLSNARTLSSSSYVNSIYGLTLWLDATAENSIATSLGTANLENNSAIQTWTDQNSQVAGKITFTSVASENTKYKTNGINGLPTVFFDAAADSYSGDSMSAPYSNQLNTSQFTYFLVTRPMEVVTFWSSPVMNANATTGANNKGFGLYKSGSSANWQFWGANGATIGAKANDPDLFSYNADQIITLSYNGTNYSIYHNGLLKASNAGTYIPNPTEAFYIGKSITTFYYDGYMSEIIMYNRGLKNTERRTVEEYLSKKYAIPLS